jgi:hypothetical protein
MPLILGTNSIKDTGYDVANSLRFNSGSSDDLVYTPSSTGNRRTFTWSFWVKRSKLGANQMTLFKKEGSGSDTNGNGNPDYLGLAYFLSDDTLQVARNQEGDFVNVKTTRVFRDVSAWYHIIVSIDTTQGTGSNRVRCWVNGTEESLTFTVTPTQNRQFDFNQSGEAHHLGSYGGGSYLDGYLTECVFLDGTAVTGATDFGEFDEDSPTIWKPKDVSGLTFGTNGFYLDFENASSLGADVSGNSNNFTVNNLTSIDQTTDTCTNNFCTFLSTDKSASAWTLSEGNLKCEASTGTKGLFGTSIMPTTGKWYFEVKIGRAGSSDRSRVGIMNFQTYSDNNYTGVINTPSQVLAGVTTSCKVGKHFVGVPGSVTEFTASGDFSDDDIVNFAMDLDNKAIYIGRNGTYLTTTGSSGGDPTSGSSKTGAISTNTTIMDGSPMTAYTGLSVGSGSDTSTMLFNFGNPPFSISSGNSDADGHGNFEYAPPSGYFALCSKNLAEYG